MRDRSYDKRGLQMRRSGLKIEIKKIIMLMILDFAGMIPLNVHNLMRGTSLWGLNPKKTSMAAIDKFQCM